VLRVVKWVGLSMAPEFRSHMADGRLDSPRAKFCLIDVSMLFDVAELSFSESLKEGFGNGGPLFVVELEDEGIVDDAD
jgi:hypothetical protein